MGTGFDFPHNRNQNWNKKLIIFEETGEAPDFQFHLRMKPKSKPR